MYKAFLGLLLAFLIAAPAQAGWQLRQNADGTADWVDTRNGNAFTVGSYRLTVQFENVSTAATVAVVNPINNMKISYIQSVMMGDITTADAKLDFWISTDQGGTVSSEVTNTTARMTLTAVAANELGDVDTFTPTAENAIEKDQVIFVHSNGGSTNDVDVMITITLVPR
jgi:hypothetical protein